VFSILDWCVLVVYLVLSSGLGLALAGKSKNAGEFLFGGRSMPWFAVGVSLIATSVSVNTFLGNPSEAYQHNMTMLMYSLGGLLAIPVIWFIFIPRFAQANVSSAYQLLELRFNRSVRLVAAGFYTGHLVLRTGVTIFGPSLILSEISGLSPSLSIIITGVIAVAYTCVGGIRAVIWTDVIQFIVLFGGGVFVLVYIGMQFNSFSDAWNIASQAGHTQIIDLDMDLANARTLFSASLIYVVFEIAIRGCDQQFVQRYISVGSARHANYSSLLSVVIGFFVAFLFYTVGIFLWSYYHAVAPLPESIRVDKIFPYFITHALPVGSAGLLVAAIFAAAMSSLDSAISALANTTVMDFYNKDDSTSVKLVQIWTVIWGCVGIAAAFICLNDSSNLLQMAYKYLSLFTGPLLGFFLAAFFFSNIKPYALIIGALSGMLFLGVYPYLVAYYGFVKLAWVWNPIIALCAMFSMILIIHIFGNFIFKCK